MSPAAPEDCLPVRVAPRRALSPRTVESPNTGVHPMSDTATFPAIEETKVAPDVDGWWQELNMLDVAAYAAIAATPTPELDRVLRRVSRAADHWKLWLGSAAALATVGGPRGRRSAVNGVAAMVVSSAVVHLALKPLGGRRRPDRVQHQVPITRQVSMPISTSFPSGHAASAAAFATGVASAFPEAGIPLGGAAALVAYSRVHTGVHYPGDVIVGFVTGTALAQLVVAALARRPHRRAVAHVLWRRVR
jgi:membrane-associated phospholipid phosphatase